jgi:UDP-N-acetylglucosamine--N-acetylmuramyl-(pentapeptide) pyrophosphoryl-undecaprenol N-acetylglucosamine transferase
MTLSTTQQPFVAIACGGTGGHLFPGLAVADQLRRRGCAVALLISPKDVDQQAVQSARDLEIVTLPAVALQNRNYLSFAQSFRKSWLAARKLFTARPPQAVLAMGGFTSVPPVLAAKRFRAQTFLHESNTIPGRANRVLARFVNRAFIGFPEAGPRLRYCAATVVSGTPVRLQFQPRDPAVCRAQLGLDPHRPTILVMGGSQGASGINELILSVLPLLGQRDWQWLHLTGPTDFAKVTQAYATRGLTAVVKPFLAEMELAMAAATVAVSRSGASSLAEIAALRLPSLLVPYPTAADNHQMYNALAFVCTGAAQLLEQKEATPGKCLAALQDLMDNEQTRAGIRTSLVRWHSPHAAEEIAENILQAIAQPMAASQPAQAGTASQIYKTAVL